MTPRQRRVTLVVGILVGVSAAVALAVRAMNEYARRRRSRIARGDRLRRLIVPPRESAPLSGVCPLMTSIWSYIVLVRLLMLVPRPIAPLPPLKGFREFG